jgi:hypothetical protein
MEKLSNPRAIIDYCLAPLELSPSNEAGQEVRKRLEHAIKAFQRAAARPVEVDFSEMRSQVINEAAFGHE